MQTLSHASCTVLLTDLLERCLDLLVCVESCLVHQVVQPSLIKKPFCFAEWRLDRIVLRRISNIKYSFHVEFFVPWLDFLRLMNRKLIHKKGQRLLTWPFTKLFEVGYEIVRINGLWMNLSIFVASFLWHASYHWAIACVDVLLINGEIGVLGWPLTRLDRKFGEIDLIKVDEASSLLLGLLNLIKDIFAVLYIV